MSKLLDMPQALKERRQFGFFDDMLWYVTVHLWTTTVSDSGTIAGGDAAGGIVTLTPSDGTVGDNDEAYLQTTKELFLIAADKPILFEALIKFVEANTDDANVAAGLADAPIANTLVDNGAGLKTSFSGAVIYKVDGGTVWKFVTSNGATQTISTSTTTAGGSAYQRLRIEINPISSLACEAIPYVDGVQLADSNGKPIKHTILFASATEMAAFVGVKNGDTNLETLLVDYIAAWQLR